MLISEKAVEQQKININSVTEFTVIQLQFDVIGKAPACLQSLINIIYHANLGDKSVGLIQSDGQI